MFRMASFIITDAVKSHPGLNADSSSYSEMLVTLSVF